METRSIAAAKRKALAEISSNVVRPMAGLLQPVLNRLISQPKRRQQRTKIAMAEDAAELRTYQLQREEGQRPEGGDYSVSPSQRAILVDWMMHVSREHHLQQQTLELAVALLDRSVSLVTDVRLQLQALGAAALLLAAKLEETEFLPDELLYTIPEDSRYILRWERELFQHVSFTANLVLPHHFLSHYILSPDVLELAVYLCNVGLYSALMLLPSQLAASAIFLGCLLLDSPAQLEQKPPAQHVAELARAVSSVQGKDKLAMNREKSARMRQEMCRRLNRIAVE